jgi:tRNA pseudouridine38-40 synthase
LPRDVLVVDADEVPLEFHATYAAKRKRYRYIIHNARAAHPFLRNSAYDFHATLDAREMHAAGQVLVGTHDFRAFETQHPNTASSVRTVFELSVGRFSEWTAWNARKADRTDATPPRADGLGDFISIDVVADGFLYNMVRTIVGTLIRVGERKWDSQRVREILERGDRPQAGPTAPACGLYLVRVDYDEART